MLLNCNKDCFNCQYSDCTYEGYDTRDIDVTDDDVGVIRSRQYKNYKKYMSTEKGRQARQRYWNSEKGKQARIRSENSEKRKAYLQLEDRKNRQKENYRIWRENNAEHLKESKKEYESRPEVKEKRKEWNRKYNSKPEVKERMKLYMREYRKRKLLLEE